MKTGGKLGKNVDGNANPVIRDRVRPAVAVHFPAMTAVYLSFRAEGQGSWERLSFPGIIGGGYACTPGSGEMPGTEGGWGVFVGKHIPRWVSLGYHVRITVASVG